MPILKFPPVDSALEDGLLAIGGDLTVPSLLLAYSSGIFPWPHREDELLWYSPPVRGILFLDKFKTPKSLVKELKKHDLSFSINSDFKTVIEHCSKVKRSSIKGSTNLTWITQRMLNAYIDLNQAGYAFSFECYRNGNTNEKQLIGGGYCVRIENFVAGESLFHLEDNGSKFALNWICQKLNEEGVKWIDCQMVTPLLKSFGAEEMERKDYIKLLKKKE